MAQKTVAVIGSGIVGTTIAYHLTLAGHRVNVFEKGPDYPYPHNEQFLKEIWYLSKNDPAYTLPHDLKKISVRGDYQPDLNSEVIMHLGGAASRWTALTLRMSPNDFKTGTLYGFGADWPITYEDLEPYYCRAESYLGVAGLTDNPFAPWRSMPYPMTGFEMSYENRFLAERLRNHEIVLHTVPQARTRHNYDGRAACANLGTCNVCPIGARYSPAFHLQRAIQTGLCKLYLNTSVRKIVVENGTARSIVCHVNQDPKETELAADMIFVSAGAIESSRLLLLSRDAAHPDGIGNHAGLVGKNLMFHHLWGAVLHYKEKLYPGRIGPSTGECHQFTDPQTRGKHGGIKIAVWSEFTGQISPAKYWRDGEEVIHALEPLLHTQSLSLHAETVPSDGKKVVLADQRDRFGDPFAQVHYESNDFDRETYGFARKLFRKFQEATGAVEGDLARFRQYTSGHHHMGTCRMGQTEKDSVVDSLGRVHGIRNLFVLGGSTFAGSSTVNPTLTMVALALRTVDSMKDSII